MTGCESFTTKLGSEADIGAYFEVPRTCLPAAEHLLLLCKLLILTQPGSAARDKLLSLGSELELQTCDPEANHHRSSSERSLL